MQVCAAQGSGRKGQSHGRREYFHLVFYDDCKKAVGSILLRLTKVKGLLEAEAATHQRTPEDTGWNFSCGTTKEKGKMTSLAKKKS